MATTTTKTKSPFEILQGIDCKEVIEKKNGLSYVSWAYAWGFIKQNFPDANYTIYENAEGWNYHTDGRTCWVKTGVTINGVEHVEYLPVMDNRNASIPLERVNSFDVNKAIQRSLTKACARHGLGLYVYAGEDLPLELTDEKAAAPAPVQEQPYTPLPNETYWKTVQAYAAGKKSKTGGDLRLAWINATHAKDEQIKQFDKAVADLKKAWAMQAQEEPAR